MTEATRRYGTTAIVVHWSTAAAVSLAVALGLRMSDAGGVERDSALVLHASLGICILGLSIFRIVHLSLHRAPPPRSTTRAEAWLRRCVHGALYVLLVTVPLLGWLNLSSASDGFSYKVFGVIPWPAIPGVAGVSAAGELAESAHRVLAYAICALLALHVAGAARHQLKDPGDGLARILPGEHGRFGWRSASVVAGLALLFTWGFGSADHLLPRALRIVSTEAPPRPWIDPRKSTLFASVVQPILDEKCVTCHGSRTQKGGLRLDSYTAVHDGGDGGKVIEARKADESELVRRLMLQKSDDDAMPPKGKTVVTPAEAQLLLWWIGAGADDQTTIAAADAPPLVRQILRDLGVRNDSPVFAEPVARARPEVLDRLGETFRIRPVYAGAGFLRAQAQFGADADQASSVAALDGLAGQLVWLDLSYTGLTDEQLSGLGRLRKLQHLNLAGTKAGDRTIETLRHLQYLEVLNLYGTTVTDATLAGLAQMPSLTSVYLSQTAVTPTGIERFSREHPRIRVVWQASPADASVMTKPAPGVGREKSNAESP